MHVPRTPMRRAARPVSTLVYLCLLLGLAGCGGGGRSDPAPQVDPSESLNRTTFHMVSLAGARQTDPFARSRQGTWTLRSDGRVERVESTLDREGSSVAARSGATIQDPDPDGFVRIVEDEGAIWRVLNPLTQDIVLLVSEGMRPGMALLIRESEAAAVGVLQGSHHASRMQMAGTTVVSNMTTEAVGPWMTYGPASLTTIDNVAQGPAGPSRVHGLQISPTGRVDSTDALLLAGAVDPRGRLYALAGVPEDGALALPTLHLGVAKGGDVLPRVVPGRMAYIHLKVNSLLQLEAESGVIAITPAGWTLTERVFDNEAVPAVGFSLDLLTTFGSGGAMAVGLGPGNTNYRGGIAPDGSILVLGGALEGGLTGLMVAVRLPDA